MNIGWSRWKDTGTGVVTHSLIKDTTILARVVKTGRSGIDNYPWDWYLEDRVEAKPGHKTSGVADSMRAAKEDVEWALGLR